MKHTIVLAVISLVNFSAQAVEAPAKEGTESFTANYVVRTVTPMRMGSRTVVLLDFGGVISGGKVFNNLGAHCLAMRETVGDNTTGRGFCTEMDADGDQIFVSYTVDESKGSGNVGTRELVGGTGKYAGISGKQQFTVQFVKGPDELRMFAVPISGHWKLP